MRRVHLGCYIEVSKVCTILKRDCIFTANRINLPYPFICCRKSKENRKRQRKKAEKKEEKKTGKRASKKERKESGEEGEPGYEVFYVRRIYGAGNA